MKQLVSLGLGPQYVVLIGTSGEAIVDYRLRIKSFRKLFLFKAPRALVF